MLRKWWFLGWFRVTFLGHAEKWWFLRWFWVAFLGIVENMMISTMISTMIFRWFWDSFQTIKKWLNCNYHFFISFESSFKSSFLGFSLRFPLKYSKLEKMMISTMIFRWFWDSLQTIKNDKTAGNYHFLSFESSFLGCSLRFPQKCSKMEKRWFRRWFFDDFGTAFKR